MLHLMQWSCQAWQPKDGQIFHNEQQHVHYHQFHPNFFSHSQYFHKPDTAINWWTIRNRNSTSDFCLLDFATKSRNVHMGLFTATMKLDFVFCRVSLYWLKIGPVLLNFVRCPIHGFYIHCNTAYRLCRIRHLQGHRLTLLLPVF